MRSRFRVRRGLAPFMNPDLDHKVIPRILERRGSGPDFGIGMFLEHAREGLQSRISDSSWQGGQALVVDFAEQQWDLAGVTGLSRQSAHVCLNHDFDLFYGLPEQCLDLIVLNLLPAWCDFQFLLEQARSRLNSGGLFVFSSFGPDTLNEVVRAWAPVDGYQHVHRFIDMHDLGDVMLCSGLACPIVDTEWMNFIYPDYQTLARDFRAGGFSNVHQQRRKSLTGKNRHAQFMENFRECISNSGGAISFEYIYGLGFVQDRSSVKVQPPQP